MNGVQSLKEGRKQNDCMVTQGEEVWRAREVQGEEQCMKRNEMQPLKENKVDRKNNELVKGTKNERIEQSTGKVSPRR